MGKSHIHIQRVSLVVTARHGYDTGTIGGILAMKFWRREISIGYINPTDNYPDVTSSQKSLIVSILSAGTFFGALLSAPVADGIGR